MPEDSEIDLGKQVAALCVKASSDAPLRAHLEQDPLSTLRAEGIEVPAEAEEQTAALVRATLYGIATLTGR